MPMKEMTRAQVLRTFFFRDGKDTLTSFLAEMKALTDTDRTELCELAAKELQVTVKAA